MITYKQYYVFIKQNKKNNVVWIGYNDYSLFIRLRIQPFSFQLSRFQFLHRDWCAPIVELNTFFLHFRSHDARHLLVETSQRHRAHEHRRTVAQWIEEAGAFETDIWFVFR